MHDAEPLHNLLSRAARRAERCVAASSIELGLSPASERILRAIPLEGVTTASEIAARLGFNRATILRGLRRLERTDCLEPMDATNPADLRLRPVRLSDVGRAVWRCVAADPDPLAALLAAQLDAAALAALRRALRVIADLQEGR